MTSNTPIPASTTSAFPKPQIRSRLVSLRAWISTPSLFDSSDAVPGAATADGHARFTCTIRRISAFVEPSPTA